MAKTVTAIFDDANSASTAIDRITAMGIPRDSISVLMSEETRGRHFSLDTGTKAPEGATAGGIAGGAIGALIGGLAAVGTLAVTGVGLVAVGPLVAALAGLGIGGTAGGIIGGLIGLGIPEHEAEMAAEQIERGGILVGVEVVDSDQADEVEAVFNETRAHSLATY